ncbi:MAG TPA: hypothetical protein VHC18_06665 [Amycolatopsis sp.]|nr:hypothetical protein [Amycolatopsis sp.]
MVITRLARDVEQRWRHWVLQWLPFAVLAATALTAYSLSGNAWPWVYTLGAVVVLALLGVPKRYGPARTISVGLLVADVAWLAATPWWGWSVIVGSLALLVGAGALIKRKGLQPHSWQVVTALAVGLALIGAGTVAWRITVVRTATLAAQQQRDLHEDTVSHMLPDTPAGMINYLVRWIATYPTYKDAGANFCFPWTAPAAGQFAAALHVPDCLSGVAALTRQVKDAGDYQNQLYLNGSASQYVGRDTVLVDACGLEVGPDQPGPSALGHFTLQNYRGGGYKITAYAPC